VFAKYFALCLIGEFSQKVIIILLIVINERYFCAISQQLFLLFQNLVKPADIHTVGRGSKRGAQLPGRRITTGAPNHYGERRLTAGAPKSPNNITSIFFNPVLLLPKDLKFDSRGAKLASCPGAA